MSFKDNLLKKIQIDKLADRVLSTIGPVDSGKKVDKQAMRKLLEMGPYETREERDLELYIKKDGKDGKNQILVLDNDLPVYRTDIADVALRKSPTVKEMVNIKNAIKILNDKDVLRSKKEESVETIRGECIGLLDLDYVESDIEEIMKDGQAALENNDSDGVVQSLEFFAELLGLAPPPKAFFLANFKMFGEISRDAKGDIFYGPVVLYSVVRNDCKLVERRIGSFDEAGIESFYQIATGSENAGLEGIEVFGYLKNWVMKKKMA
jgi:hypothetical protein